MRGRLRSVLAAALLCCGPTGGGANATCPTDRPVRVAVDIGHSIAAPGALSASGRHEYAFNQRFVGELVEKAKNRTSLNLVVVNSTGEDVMLRSRIAQAEDFRADVFVSIHHDSVNEKYMLTREGANGRTHRYTTAFRGFSLFVYEPGRRFAESLALAEQIARNFKDAGAKPTLHHAEPIPGEGRKLLDSALGIYAAPFTVLKSERMPSVLVELGVITNPEDEALLERRDVRDKLAESILAALENTCARNGASTE